ncbi:MAG: MarR family winged helix-turn-helix transcriptional regulator [Mycobacteriales bacterium]
MESFKPGTAFSPPAALLDQLLELSRLVVGVAYRSLEDAEPEVDLPAFRALAFVDRHPGSTMGALAAGIHLPASSTTRLCDRLVDAGWLVRRQDQDNRRRVELQLTGAGRTVVRRLLRARRSELARIARRLPPHRLAALADLLPDLVAAAAAQEPPTPQAWAV